MHDLFVNVTISDLDIPFLFADLLINSLVLLCH